MQTELNYDSVFDAQEHFRLFLDSMSRPGKINTLPVMEILPPDGLQQAAALTGFALLNNDVTFYIAGDNQQDIATYLLVNTGAQQAEVDVADYVFLPEGYYGEELYDARTGTPTYPEDSATIIVQIEFISELPKPGSLEITLKGPGVNGETKVYVGGINTDLLDFVKIQNGEYPLGIDLIITDRENNVIGLPRSNNFTYAPAIIN
jgi:alpha-D-ribose 1-methylphosphonate 5-triphosphate synthase subunit PhnH